MWVFANAIGNSSNRLYKITIVQINFDVIKERLVFIWIEVKIIMRVLIQI